MKIRISVVALAVAACFGTVPVQAQDGADTYKSKCMMCHGADGVGATPAGKMLKVVSFKSSDLIKASDVDLIAATTNGKGKMPAYQGKLTDAQIKDVISYIRTLQK